ncbi:unnamed protein product [Gadus morhua 'NCC']
MDVLMWILPLHLFCRGLVSGRKAVRPLMNVLTRDVFMFGAYGASAERRGCAVGVRGEQRCPPPLLRPGLLPTPSETI